MLRGLAAGLGAVGRPAWLRAEESAYEAMARAALAFLGALDSRRRRRQATFRSRTPSARTGTTCPAAGRECRSRTWPPTPGRRRWRCSRWACRRRATPKARDVLRLEGVLRQLETFGGFTRDPDNYAVTIFGAPEQPAPWGWRFEGHHLSLNFTVAPGRAIAVTPAFFGANPAEVPSGPLEGLRVLQAEQDLGLALAGGLDPGQRARATIAAESLGDIVSGPGRGESLRTPAGCRSGTSAPTHGPSPCGSSRRTPGTCGPISRKAELRKLHAAGLERVHFAWAGPVDPEASALLPPPRADAAHRVRQHPERREPHPLGLARSPQATSVPIVLGAHYRTHRDHA